MVDQKVIGLLMTLFQQNQSHFVKLGKQINMAGIRTKTHKEEAVTFSISS